MWIDQAFPRLAQEGYLITSQPDQNYNCIAYAAGDTGSWWSHLPGYRWPQANRTDHPDSLVEVFQVLGYQGLRRWNPRTTIREDSPVRQGRRMDSRCNTDA